MPLRPTLLKRCTAAAAVGLAACTGAAADDGVVRVSDGPATVGPAPVGATAGGSCRTGDCPGACSTCRPGLLGGIHALKNAALHGPGGHGTRRDLLPFLHGYDQYLPPDAGWQAPVAYPVQRTPITYHRYYPQQWYGTPGSALPRVAPMVFMPTDTTQLGYYYQRVPTWQPVAGTLPPPPNPRTLHRRECPQNLQPRGGVFGTGLGVHGGLHGRAAGGPTCQPGGTVADGGVTVSGDPAVEGTTPVTAEPVVAEPVVSEPLPGEPARVAPMDRPLPEAVPDAPAAGI